MGKERVVVLRTYRCEVCGRRNTVERGPGAPAIYCPAKVVVDGKTIRYPCAGYARALRKLEAASRAMFAHPDLELERQGDVTVKGVRMRIVNSVRGAVAAVASEALDAADVAREVMQRATVIKGSVNP